jgi:Ca-activated chloride channel homolog
MTDVLSSFHFLRPYWLLLILPALVVWRFEASVSDASDRWKRVIDRELLCHLLVRDEKRIGITPNLLSLVAWILGSVAVAGPTWVREPSPFADAKPPVMVVLGVTPSMETSDLAPTRLDRARQKLADLLALREGAATGLIAYSGSSHLVLPPTPDATVVIAMMQALEPNIMPKQGDDVAAAVVLARGVLDGNERGGSVLVVTDSVAPDQIGRFGDDDLQPNRTPTTILAMLPPERAKDEGSLVETARTLDARLVATTIDQADVAEIAQRLDRVGQPKDVAGEGQHWREYGYWLTPVLALIVLSWFRRGWVLA